MAVHNLYSFMPIGRCDCDRSRYNYLDPMTMYNVQHGDTEILYACSVCKKPLAWFYRMQEIDKRGVTADKSLVGSTVRVKRTVAWAGYALNTATLDFENAEVETEMARILRLVAKGIADEAAQAIIKDDFVDLARGRASWLHNALRQRALYELRGRKMNTNRMRERGLWFFDWPGEVEVRVMGFVRCWTGTQVPGGIHYSWDYGEEYESPSFIPTASHQLFKGLVLAPEDYLGHYRDQFGQYDFSQARVLIYPGDALTN